MVSSQSWLPHNSSCYLVAERAVTFVFKRATSRTGPRLRLSGRLSWMVPERSVQGCAASPLSSPPASTGASSGVGLSNVTRSSGGAFIALLRFLRVGPEVIWKCFSCRIASLHSVACRQSRKFQNFRRLDGRVFFESTRSPSDFLPTFWDLFKHSCYFRHPSDHESF